MNARRFVAIVLVLILPAAGAAYYWGRQLLAPAQVKAAPVLSGQTEKRKPETAVSATGTVRLKVGAEVRVGSQLSGIVKKLNVTVGSHIKKGDVIAEIDSAGLQARIEDARAQIRMDEVALEKSRRDLARDQRLFGSGVLPRKDLDDADAQVQGDQAKLDKSKNDLAVVEVDLAYVKITAPISGTVASVATQEGETVAASFAAPTFVTIIEDNALELVAMVDETDISNVHVGDPVTFTVETYPSRDLSGIVKRIAPKATIVSGVVNYEVGIAIDRKEISLLKPDMTANISIKNRDSAAAPITNAGGRRANRART